VLFSGNVYNGDTQPEANQVLIQKLNRLGQLLHERNARLFMMGTGDVGGLDQGHVTYLGPIPYQETWDYFHHADAGIVLALGSFLHNNESTKIYSYLRAGLPIVSEAGFPNDHVVQESGLGFVVRNGDMDLMASRAIEATTMAWDRGAALDYLLGHHTWDKRAALYEPILRGVRPPGELIAR
jgi:hypothetical protein